MINSSLHPRIEEQAFEGRDEELGLPYALSWVWSHTSWSHTSRCFCCCSVAKSCPTLCDPMGYSMPTFPVHHQLLELTHTHVHQVGDAIQPCHPLSSPSPLACLSQHQGLFQWVSSSHQWPKYWSFSFSISPSKERSGLISFRMDWLDLHAVQGTLKSLLQHYSSKASIHQSSAFFIVQLSHPYMSTGNT